MSEHRPFQLYIHTAERDFFNGECVSLIVPIPSGQYGIMANHRNMIAALVPGDVWYTDKEGNRNHCVVSAGLVKVENGVVTMLVNRAASLEELEGLEKKTKLDNEEEERMRKRQSKEYMEAEAIMRRTIYKLKNTREIQ
ncbi:MAG: F0F1 ATP synthase subunit epsilon [Lachnospiraceae bacterium]|nr:F0F1 ATP synthase subunit epsilon [Lachnospiraceae bacterium]